MKNTVYKFQNWSNKYNRKSFLEGTAYFSNNYSLNDPFDLQLPILTSGKRVFDEKAFKIDFENQNNMSLTNEMLVEARKTWESTKHEKSEIEINGWNNIKAVSDEVENKLGVLCLSKRRDSTLMWGHYANSHSGYCIGYDQDKLIEFIKDQFGNAASILDVDYVDEIPTWDYGLMTDIKYLRETIDKRFSTKHSDWKYEDEIRIIVDQYSQNLLKLPSNIFKEIIFGYKMEEVEIMELTILCKELYPNIEFFRAKPNDKKFNMQIYSIV